MFAIEIRNYEFSTMWSNKTSNKVIETFILKIKLI